MNSASSTDGSYRLILSIVLSAALAAAAYALGHANAHADLLEQCKSEQHGIRLSVGNKQYFYYCSYQKP